MPKTIAALVFALLALLAIAVAWHDRGMAVDDAYITFRYAENLLAGHGLRWNPASPPCEGYSNLSYVVGIAALGWFGVPPAPAAVLLAGTGIATIALLLWRATRGAGSFLPLALLPGLLLFARDDLTVHASRGLETVLFGALAACLLAAVARLCGGEPPTRRHAVAAALCACLLFLTRPDGVLLAGTCWLAAGWLVRADRGRRRLLLLAVGLWLAAGAAYAAAKLAWFGHLLPNPFYMKADVVGFVGVPETLAFLRAYAPLLGCLLLAVAAARRSPASPGVHAAPVLALAMSVPWLVYGAKIMHEIGFSHRFAWPLVPVVALGATRGLAELGARLTAGRWARAWPLAWLLLLAAAVFAGDPLVGPFRHLHQPRPHDPCTAAFLRLGQAIHDTGIAPELTLFCANAGATPFVAGAHHVDPAGLVDDGYCQRTPQEERARYQASLHFDVVAWNLFPASPGAASFDDDPRALASPYLAHSWRDDDPELDANARYGISRQTVAERKAALFLPMYVLREHGTLVGEMDTGLSRARLFVYVWKQSPHHDRLVAHLAGRVDVPAAAIDYEGR